MCRGFAPAFRVFSLFDGCAMNEPAAPAADITGGVGVPEAVRIQRHAREGLRSGPWLNETARKAAACKTIQDWLGQVFRRHLVRDALRFMNGRHGWGWKYLDKYTQTGKPNPVLTLHEQIVARILKSQNPHEATHGSGEHLVHLRFPTRFNFITRHGYIIFQERKGLISIRLATVAE